MTFYSIFTPLRMLQILLFLVSLNQNRIQGRFEYVYISNFKNALFPVIVLIFKICSKWKLFWFQVIFCAADFLEIRDLSGHFCKIRQS